MIAFTFRAITLHLLGDLMTYPAFALRPLRSLLLALLIAATFPSLISATEKIDLNGPWLFRVDPKSEGESHNWFKTIPTGTESDWPRIHSCRSNSVNIVTVDKYAMALLRVSTRAGRFLSGAANW
jgi:hypothetical protein